MTAPSGERKGGEVAALVAAWDRHDAERAVVPADRRALVALPAARALVADLARRGESRDLLHACAVLGQLLAHEDASPTLALGTLPALGRLLAGPSGEVPRWVAAAQGALVEAYVAARVDAVERRARAHWSFEACSVPLGADEIALAAGFPTDDLDAVRAWAEELAREASRRGVRRVALAGRRIPREALAEALAFAGVRVVEAGEARGGGFFASRLRRRS